MKDKPDKNKNWLDDASDNFVKWVGSTGSLIIHTIIFICFFVAYWFGFSLNSVLLVLTTLVSLEAIYLAIFIQRSVNQQAMRLNYVEESLDDVEESLDDVEESIDDVEENLAKKHHGPDASHDKLHKSIEEIIKELKSLKDELKDDE